jgi:dihydrofolate reductase
VSKVIGRRAPVVSLVVAMAENRVIGRDNRMPWHLPADLAHFKALTMGKPIIMGRLTWESLPGLLPGRRHIVLTHDRGYSAPGVTLVHSLAEALDAAGAVDEVMVVGGARLYAEALPLADRIYLTLVHGVFEGDARFPAIDPAEWIETSREHHAPDDRNPCPYTFLTLRRRETATG